MFTGSGACIRVPAIRHRIPDRASTRLAWRYLSQGCQGRVEAGDSRCGPYNLGRSRRSRDRCLLHAVSWRLRIPTHADHRFRSMPITDSSACRSLWSEQVAVLENLL